MDSIYSMSLWIFFCLNFVFPGLSIWIHKLTFSSFNYVHNCMAIPIFRFLSPYIVILVLYYSQCCNKCHWIYLHLQLTERFSAKFQDQRQFALSNVLNIDKLFWNVITPISIVTRNIWVSVSSHSPKTWLFHTLNFYLYCEICDIYKRVTQAILKTKKTGRRKRGNKHLCAYNKN